MVLFRTLHGQAHMPALCSWGTRGQCCCGLVLCVCCLRVYLSISRQLLYTTFRRTFDASAGVTHTRSSFFVIRSPSRERLVLRVCVCVFVPPLPLRYFTCAVPVQLVIASRFPVSCCIREFAVSTAECQLCSRSREKLDRFFFRVFLSRLPRAVFIVSIVCRFPLSCVFHELCCIYRSCNFVHSRARGFAFFVRVCMVWSHLAPRVWHSSLFVVSLSCVARILSLRSRKVIIHSPREGEVRTRNLLPE